MASSVKVMESRFVKSCTSIANAPQILSAEIAILGRSNVGKSSLINALLNNKNLAKSSSTPGKTRLVNFFESKWKIINNPCVSTPNLARFVVQKIGFKDAVVPSADFLLESEKRGTPPKSEKRQLLARRGSGAGGAALLRKEKGESQSKKIVGDSRIAKMDSSLRTSCYAQNDESFLDCHDSDECPNLAMTDMNHKISQKAEFAIHIIDFPGFGYAKVSKTERDSWDKNLSIFLKKRESIKLFIHLIDSRHTNLPLDDEIRAFLRSNLRADADILEVFTKADKLKKSEIHALKGKILVSVTKKDLGQRDFKDSIESLRHAILRTMYHI